MKKLITLSLTFFLFPITVFAQLNTPDDYCVKFKMLGRNDQPMISTGMLKTMERVYKEQDYINRGSCYTATSWSGKTTTHLYSTPFMRVQSVKDREYLMGKKINKEKTASEILLLLLKEGYIDQLILDNLKL